MQKQMTFCGKFLCCENLTYVEKNGTVEMLCVILEYDPDIHVLKLSHSLISYHRLSEFRTTQKPEGMVVTSVPVSNTKMYIELRWTPTKDQSEQLHKVCFSAKDSKK